MTCRIPDSIRCCLSCSAKFDGDTTIHHARGLCRSCYHRTSRAGKLHLFPRLAWPPGRAWTANQWKKEQAKFNEEILASGGRVPHVVVDCPLPIVSPGDHFQETTWSPGPTYDEPQRDRGQDSVGTG